MLTALKNYNKDLYRNEASGCFEPHMGIVFYKDGIVNAHIDVCLTCNRIHFEIVKEARVFYKFNLAPLGDNLEKVFESFIPKYRLITCD